MCVDSLLSATLRNGGEQLRGELPAVRGVDLSAHIEREAATDEVVAAVAAKVVRAF